MAIRVWQAIGEIRRIIIVLKLVVETQAVHIPLISLNTTQSILDIRASSSPSLIIGFSGYTNFHSLLKAGVVLKKI